jgi:hypothetical protein
MLAAIGRSSIGAIYFVRSKIEPALQKPAIIDADRRAASEERPGPRRCCRSVSSWTRAMAKKRKKRRTANLVPKRIAGMKTPKALRRGKVGRLLASPAGQALIAATIARAGEPLIGRDARPGSAARTTAVRAQGAISEFGEGTAESSAAFIYALRQAARAFVTAMQESQVAARTEAGRDEERLEKKEQGERPDRRTAH